MLIAGAGPIGLFLACELRLGGCSVLVPERAADARSPLKQVPFGIRGLSATSLEAIHRRGLLAEVAAGQPADMRKMAHWIQQARRPAGHFAGIQFYEEEDVDALRWADRVPGVAGLGLPTTLEHLEAALVKHAAALGVAVRRGMEFEAVSQSAEDVAVFAGGKTFHAQWLKRPERPAPHQDGRSTPRSRRFVPKL